MSVRTYLPSAQFFVIAGALAFAGGSVAAAQYYVSSKNTPAALASAQNALSAQQNAWTESLADIQAQSGVNLPEAPNEDTIASLLTQAQSDNLTDSIGRGLLVKLTNAGVQGLGSDIPTQESIIAEATAQINASSQIKLPTITTVDASEITLRAYGNEVMATLNAHGEANSNEVLRILAKATDERDSSQLGPLKAVGAGYRALSQELAAIPVPQTLSPLHRQMTANIGAVADLFPDLGKAVDDPLRALAAMQRYQQLLDETGRILTNLAEALQKGGILFSKDEPGSAWGIFLSAP